MTGARITSEQLRHEVFEPENTLSSFERLKECSINASV